MAREKAGDGAQGTEGERAAARGPMDMLLPRPTVMLRGIIFSLMGLRGSVRRRRMAHSDANVNSLIYLV